MLAVQATNTDPFILQLRSFDANGSGEVTNFNADSSYTWTISLAASGLFGFAAGKFTFDTSTFQNDLAGGYFSVGTNANALTVSFTNNHPPSTTTWFFYQGPNGVAIPLTNLATHWSDVDGDPVILEDVNTTSANGVPVSFDSRFIYYSGTSTVADTLTYTVQDVRTNPPAVYRPGDTQRTANGNVILLPRPFLGRPAISGSNLVCGVSGGIPGGTFAVLTSTNLTEPLNQWQPLSTNTFDTNGHFVIVTPLPGTPHRFLRVQTMGGGAF